MVQPSKQQTEFTKIKLWGCTHHGTGEGEFEEVGLCGGVQSNLGRCATKSLGSGPGLRLEGSLVDASEAGFALLLFLHTTMLHKNILNLIICMFD